MRPTLRDKDKQKSGIILMYLLQGSTLNFYSVALVSSSQVFFPIAEYAGQTRV